MAHFNIENLTFSYAAAKGRHSPENARGKSRSTAFR